MGIELSDRVLFSRRRALALAGTGLGSLALAGCGDSSASDASGSDTGSGAKKSSSPSPTREKKYSGGSKAPDGEYRLADELGPAQNVPKPAQPKKGYTLPTPDGLGKSIIAWLDWKNYGMQTGDFDTAIQFIDTDFKKYRDGMKSTTKLYEDGGWVIDGIQRFGPLSPPIIYSGERYLWQILFSWKKYIEVRPDGTQDVSENPYPDGGIPKWLECKHNGVGWVIKDILDQDEYTEKYDNSNKG